MIDIYEGIIIFSKKIKDYDLYIRILSSEDKLISGIVYGGNSSKKKLIYQVGYFVEFSILQKNKNIPPTFNAEIISPFIASILKDQFKSYCLLGIISLINISIIEGQKLSGLYESIKNIVEIISLKRNWISFFCVWLFTFLQIIGYQIEYKNKKNYKFFNLNTQGFENSTMNHNSIIFPHKMLEHRDKINFNNVNAIFKIFESIYSKNHLDNMNYKMPINFINFKNKILKTLKEMK
jgi:DNA repair protein RecO